MNSLTQAMGEVALEDLCRCVLRRDEHGVRKHVAIFLERVAEAERQGLPKKRVAMYRKQMRKILKNLEKP